MVLPPAARSKESSFCVLALFLLMAGLLPAHAQARSRTEEDNAVAAFRKHHGKNYLSVNSIMLNSRPYVIAFWNEGGHPILLRADIFQYDKARVQGEFEKVYSGDVSEEVIGIYAFSVDGSGQEQLIFLSNSGQLKIVRILAIQKSGSMNLIFMNGGADVSLLSDSREIWIKNSVGQEIDVYEWDEQTGRIQHKRSVSVLF